MKSVIGATTAVSGLEDKIWRQNQNPKIRLVEIPKKTILVVMPHDDDIISLYTLIKRNLKKYNWEICILSNGDTNSQSDIRKKELSDALDYLEILNKNRHFFASRNEKEIFSENKIYDSNSDEIVEILCDVIIQIYEKFIENKNENIQNIITTAYQGGNYTHDLINFAMYKFREIVKDINGKIIKIMETPQYELREIIHEKRQIPYVDSVANSFHLTGKPDPAQTRFDDYGLEIKDGMLRLSQEEYVQKVAFLQLFESQYKNMILPMMKNTERFDKELTRIERFRLAPETRDYTIPPHEGVLGYTLHQLNKGRHMDHEDFRRIVEKFNNEYISEVIKGSLHSLPIN